MVWIGQNLILEDHDDSVRVMIYHERNWIDPEQFIIARIVHDIDCNINPNDERSGFALVSAGMSVQFDRNPEYFEIGGNADLKRGMDVVAYAPLPDVPDLSGIKPMEVN